MYPQRSEKCLSAVLQETGRLQTLFEINDVDKREFCVDERVSL